MTKAKVDNNLYAHLLSVVNHAIPLEYAIRATKLKNPDELKKLREIDHEIRQYWIELGANDTEIGAESLMDFAWDMIQVGFPMTRRHDRIYLDPKLFEIINLGLSQVRGKFGAEAEKLNIPALQYFRVCDLLSGNSVFRMFNAVAECLRVALKHESPKDIDLSKFVLWIREPIHLHPGLRYVKRQRLEGEKSVEEFGLLLHTEAEFSMPELKRQIREFLYQFAVRRQSLSHNPNGDRVSRDLIHEFLTDDLFVRTKEDIVTRLDGFTSALVGLYCWDLAQEYARQKREQPLDTAIAETRKIYPKTEWAVREHYKQARLRISEVNFAI